VVGPGPKISINCHNHHLSFICVFARIVCPLRIQNISSCLFSFLSLYVASVSSLVVLCPNLVKYKVQKYNMVLMSSHALAHITAFAFALRDCSTKLISVISAAVNIYLS